MAFFFNEADFKVAGAAAPLDGCSLDEAADADRKF